MMLVSLSAFARDRRSTSMLFKLMMYGWIFGFNTACDDQADPPATSMDVGGTEVAGMMMTSGVMMVSGGANFAGEPQLTPVEGGESAGMSTQGGMEVVAMTPAAPISPVMACEDFGSTTCFANDECAADARCQNVGSEEITVACCVAGARGTLMTGDYYSLGQLRDYRHYSSG